LSLINKFSIGEQGNSEVTNVKDWGIDINQGLCALRGNKLAEVKVIDP